MIRQADLISRRALLAGFAACAFLPSTHARAGDDAADMVARTMIVGFDGDTVGSRGFRALLDLVGRRPIGGVIYMGRNVRDDAAVAEMNAALRETARVPLFVSVDEEGGSVRRLRHLGSVPATPAARDLGRAPAELSLEVYAQLAEALARLGFNLNYGPVLDLEVNGASAVIARLGRSYGTDPEVVAVHASSFIGAHQAFGVHTAVKHFPGHGSVTQDPHDVPVDATGTWSPVELEPFRLVLARERPTFLMTSHQVVANPIMQTPPGVPVTFSPAAVSVARRELGFRGLVVSDDLTMGAIANRHSPARATTGALLAGHDCVILANLGGSPTAKVEEIIAEVAGVAGDDPSLFVRIAESAAAVSRVLG